MDLLHQLERDNRVLLEEMPKDDESALAVLNHAQEKRIAQQQEDAVERLRWNLRRTPSRLRRMPSRLRMRLRRTPLRLRRTPLGCEKTSPIHEIKTGSRVRSQQRRWMKISM